MKNCYQNNFFSKKAREQKLRARSYFKLEEIDKKYNLIQKEDFILDLGAAPGSWSQYCLHKTKNKLNLLAIDLQTIEPLANLSFHQMNAFHLEPKIIKNFFLQNSSDQNQFSIILSDMAAKTTGNKFSDSMNSRELATEVLKISDSWLVKKGWLVVKFFEGEEKEELYHLCKSKFSFFKIFVPKSTRTNSREVFLILREKKIF